jgi:hypothetical protein
MQSQTSLIECVQMHLQEYLKTQDEQQLHNAQYVLDQVVLQAGSASTSPQMSRVSSYEHLVQLVQLVEVEHAEEFVSLHIN